jgi:hypothetical protein
MGVLADFFVATEPEAEHYDNSSVFPDSHRAQYKGFTEIELSTLYMIAQGLVVDDETVYEFRTITDIDDGERVTTEVLPDLVARLAVASDDALGSWAALWSETAELQCGPGELLPVLEDLRRLSRTAASESKGLYLWNCV